jgi:ATP-dependent 26S proteasome regulatory subunit
VTGITPTHVPTRACVLPRPAGCSKTTLARAAATASRATLLPLSCAQLFSMHLGEGEAAVRDVFRCAEALFFFYK